jgi:general L-amino acid transport system substrate-binding protein
MYKRLIPIFGILLILTIVLAACGGTAEPGEVQVVKETVVVTVEVPVEGAEAPAPAEAEGILSRVLERGYVVCGGRTDLAGFGMLDENGRNMGFDIDFCRAVAAAVFGDPEAVEVVPLTAADRGPALQTAEVDGTPSGATLPMSCSMTVRVS